MTDVAPVLLEVRDRDCCPLGRHAPYRKRLPMPSAMKGDPAGLMCLSETGGGHARETCRGPWKCFWWCFWFLF